MACAVCARTLQAFKVIKVNKAGRRQQRIMKLTTDSILNLNGNTICTEIHFAGLERIWLDAEHSDTFWIKYKASA